MNAVAKNAGQGMRERLVESAFDLFLRQGFNRTSVSEIVAAANATKGAFYHYFSSKDDLLIDAHVEYLGVQIAVLKQVRAGGAPLDEQLQEVISRMVLGVYHYPAHVTLFVEERRSIDPVSAKRASGLRDEFQSLFTGIIVEGVESGAFRSDFDPVTASLGLLGMLTWTFTWTTRRSEKEVRVVADQLARMAVEGLRVHQ